jgi:hypothetical protein
MDVVIFFLIILMLILITQKEGFIERFGLSGHKKEADYLLIDDTLTNTLGMEEVSVRVGPHHLQEIILNANKYIQDKVDDCSYIIETSEIKQFKGPLKEIVRVMFMCVRNKGFAYGFAVTVDADYRTAQILGARTQPLGVDSPSDVSPYVTDGTAREFTKYEIIKEKVALNRDYFNEVAWESQRNKVLER